MNKRSTVTINIPFREIENIEIEEIVKQGATYRPVLCCVITARVNDIVMLQVKRCRYRNAFFMEGISVVGDAEDIRKRIRNCREIETLEKFEYDLDKP